MWEYLVLDASVLINLQASGVAAEMLRALPGRRVVPQVTSREVVRQPIDRLIESGLIERCRLSDSATTTFLRLVGADPPDDLDDGEAAAIALAQELGATIAVDETKARRILRAHFASTTAISSVEIFALPSVVAALGSRHADAVFDAMVNARMRVMVEHEAWISKVLGPRAAECPSLKKRKQ